MEQSSSSCTSYKHCIHVVCLIRKDMHTYCERSAYLSQFLCSLIGGLKRAMSERVTHRAFLRSRKSAFSIPILSIDQPDPHIPSRESTFSTGWGNQIARPRKFLETTAFLTTPENARSHPIKAPILARLLPYWCCCCVRSQRLGVAHLLRPPVARTVIRWQQCVLSMTFLQNRCYSS